MKKELKKYAIPCESSEVTPVIDELKKYGFDVQVDRTGSILVVVNSTRKGSVYWNNASVKNLQHYIEAGFDFINPSYVLTHAHELDGARKADNTAPDGMKLATDKERNDNALPKDCVMLINSIDNRDVMDIADGWATSINPPERWIDLDFDIAIPADYVFPQPWEIAPEGYRIVTEEERRRYDVPECAKVFFTISLWGDSLNKGRRFSPENKAYAVPIGYTFEPEVVEMTMAEVCAELGKRVKIVK